MNCGRRSHPSSVGLLLRNGTLDTNGVAQALDAIERNAWLQSRLIDDLLDTSRIATGKLHFEPQPIDLNASVKAAVDTVLASAATRSIDLIVRLSPLPIIVMGEPVRLQQIAWNLVSNAIKFTEPGGQVTVLTEREGSEGRLIVDDTGVGISPDFLPHVFDRFRQADGSTSRLHGGLGLGMAIADVGKDAWWKARSGIGGRGTRLKIHAPTTTGT